MKKLLSMLFIMLPFLSFAQRQWSEMYWLYFTLDSSAYVERDFKYGGYSDSYHNYDCRDYKAQLSDSARIAYEKERMEQLKHMVFYTKEEIKRGPVRLKPNDVYNKALRAGKEPPIKHFLL